MKYKKAVPKRNEVSSPRVASIAARVLNKLKGVEGKADVLLFAERGLRVLCKAADLEAIAASALTQTADKPTRKHIGKPRIRRSGKVK